AHRVPVSADDVMIDRPTTLTVTVRSGNQQVTSLMSTEPVAVTGGTLAVMAASQMEAGVALAAGGTLRATGPLTLAATSSWTGGTITGAAGGGVASTGTLTLSGDTDKTLTGPLNNTGMISQQGLGNLVIGSGGTLDNESGGLYDLQSDAGMTKS